MCQQGDVGTSFYIVLTGKVGILIKQQEAAGSGDEEEEEDVEVGQLSAGDSFGELALISEGPRLATVVATERAVLLELTRQHLEAVAARHPDVTPVVEAFYRRRMVENLLRSSPFFSPLTPAQKAA